MNNMENGTAGEEASIKSTGSRDFEKLDTDSSSPSDEEAGQIEKAKKWSLGILADNKADVPGSVLLLPSSRNRVSLERNIPDGSSSECTSSTPETKTTKCGQIILSPQPDESRNDPLNWSVLRRDAVLLSLGLYCMIGGGMTTILAAGFTNISETYNVSIPKVALTTGLYMLGLGVGSVIISPTAIIFGKRPIYLLTALSFLLTSIWCALSPSYKSLVVARVIQGISVSSVECLPSKTISEIFFLHERAYRLGIYTLLLLGGKNLVPLVSAAIIQAGGWRWVFWTVAILIGLCFGFLFLLVPETFWERSQSSLTTTAKVCERPSQYTNYYRSRKPKSYLETLKPYSGRLGHDNWFRIAARPFVLLAYPAILWSAAVYALSVGWLIVLSESMATIFRQPATYNFDVITTGLLYISPFIGGILGTAVAGKASDFIIRFMSRRNNGVYEPEFRLIMAIPVTISTASGLMGYGWSAEQDSFWVPTVFFGIISFGCTLGSTTAITFAVDSYKDYASEALVTLNFSKNILHGLVFSLFFNSWLETDGPKVTFLALGGIQFFFLLFTIPMYIFGKRARMWTEKRNFMEKL